MKATGLLVSSCVTAVLLGAAGTLTTSWAGGPDDSGAAGVRACGLGADSPTGSIAGTGSRTGCGGTVTLTVRVYKDISWWPDTEVAKASRTGFGNGSLTARGSCDGRGSYYTHTESSTGNAVESGRVVLC
ncbi:hypothetical protein ACFPM3_10325 [Streptomyces coeruleoprunus]|uniref:Secreted protein n=1 Tax=Streptomyces coeruleoprunus TaxID=285563 RepID=A0ABV9XCA3_9ACTN